MKTTLLAAAWLGVASILVFDGCQAFRPTSTYNPPSNLEEATTNASFREAQLAQLRAAYPNAVGSNGSVDLVAISNQLYNTESRVESAIGKAQQTNDSIPSPYSSWISSGLLVAGPVAQTIRHGQAQNEAKRLALLVPSPAQTAPVVITPKTGA